MKSIILFFFFLSLTFWTLAQPFQKKYGGHGKQAIYSMVEQNGRIVTVGYTTSTGNGRQAYIAFFDKNGNIESMSSFGGEKTEAIYEIKNTKDGGFIAVGSSSSFGNKIDVLVVKFDLQGHIEWNSTYGGDLVDIGFDIIQTKDLGYMIVGETNSFGAQDHDMFALKLDRTGEVTWSNLYGSDSIDYANNIVEVDDGYIIAGETNSFGDLGWDIWLSKMSKDGEMDWSRHYGGKEDDNQDDLMINKAGNIVLVGSSESIGVKSRDIVFFELSPENGQIIKARTYGGDREEEPKSVHQAKDLGYVITGFSSSYNHQRTEEDAFVLRLNKLLMPRYSKTFGHEKNDFAWVSLIMDNNIILGGSTSSFTSLNEEEHMYMLRFPDKRPMYSCELSNVQSVMLMQDLVLKKIITQEADVIKIEAEFTRHKEIDLHFQTTEVETTNLCKDGEFEDEYYNEVFNPKQE